MAIEARDRGKEPSGQDSFRNEGSCGATGRAEGGDQRQGERQGGRGRNGARDGQRPGLLDRKEQKAPDDEGKGEGERHGEHLQGGD